LTAYGRLELGPVVGTIADGVKEDNLAIGAVAAVHLSPVWSLDLTAMTSPDFPRGRVEFGLMTTQLPTVYDDPTRLRAIGDLGVAFAPFRGTLTVAKHDLPLDLYARLSGGLVHTESPYELLGHEAQTRPVLGIGGGSRLWISRALLLNLRVSDAISTTYDVETKVGHNVVATAGLSAVVGRAR